MASGDAGGRRRIGEGAGRPRLGRGGAGLAAAALAALAGVVACCAGGPAMPARGAASGAEAASGVGAASGARSAGGPGAAGRAAAGHRVIVISLDGAGAEALRDERRRGVLGADGFERFFREGQVAAALIPVNPTLTSANHISLATGFPPAATGIVGNLFHAAGTPLAARASGFTAPIGTETLWEAARRQGRRAAVLAWPGADGEGERRTADWGLLYNNGAASAPRLLTLSHADWRPAAAGDGSWIARVRIGGAADAGDAGDAGKVAGSAEVFLELTAFPAAPAGPATAMAAASVAIAGRAGADGTMAAATDSRGAPRLRAGEWAQIAWPLPPPSPAAAAADGAAHPPRGGPAAAWVEVVSLAPDLSRTVIYFGGAYRTLAYPQSFAAELAARGLDWPGAPDDGALVAAWHGQPGIDLATWIDQAAHMAAFMGGAWRAAAARPDWDLLMGYTPVIDQAGHRLLLRDARQADFSAARRDELERARDRVWQAVDAELARLLAALDLDHTTLVVVSDHGMTPVHTVVDPNAPLVDLPPPAAGPGARAAGATHPPPLAIAVPDGGAAHVYLAAEAAADAAARGRLRAEITRRYLAWRVAGEAPIERVVTREQAASLGLDSPNSGDLILFAREGFTFRPLPAGHPSAPAPIFGTHGYLNRHSDMDAIFLAIGAGITPGPAAALPATAVAPRIAAWLGISPPRRRPPAGTTGTTGAP